MSRMKETVQELWDLQDRIKELAKQVGSRKRGDPLREAAHLERQQLFETSADLLYQLAEDQEREWEPVTEPYVIDLGAASFIAQTLVEIRDRIERELERDDLTPYMWMMLRNRFEHLNGVLGIIGGKKSRGNPIESVPTLLVYAEYEDGSIDVQEAHSGEEADEIEEGWIEEGAVVCRYSVFPELGTPATLFDPVSPLENRQRTLSPRKFDRLVRLKGGEKFDLPDEIREFVIVDDRQFYRSVDSLYDD